MGYHYLKMNNLNATFEYDKPEILVHNKEENGKMKLVALEYAVPLICQQMRHQILPEMMIHGQYIRECCGHCMPGFGNIILKVFLIPQIL